MGKLLKYGGMTWAFLGVYGIVRMASADVPDASAGIAMVIVAAIFIFPGLRMAYRGHKLLQGDAAVALRAVDVARKLERDQRAEQDAGIAAPTAQQLRIERSCPYCAEPILAQAIVCKHCGRDVPAAPRPRLGIRG